MGCELRENGGEGSLFIRWGGPHREPDAGALHGGTADVNGGARHAIHDGGLRGGSVRGRSALGVTASRRARAPFSPPCIKCLAQSQAEY
jgi:hypothetical protein